MSRDDFQRRADRVRAIPLEVVLTSWGAVRDRQDTSRWRTPRGPLSITGAKFHNWHSGHGGGGAIDLVMHLGGWDAGRAISWLERELGGHVAAPPVSTVRYPLNSMASSTHRATCGEEHSDSDSRTPRPRHRQIRLPTPSLADLSRVRRYLTQVRGLTATILDSLIDDGTLYADERGNAVFVMVAGKPNRPVGAELRGTGDRVWRGLAPGSCKNAGYFWLGHREAQHIVLCESAIDAISCFQLQTQLPTPPLPAQCICISTAGVRSDAPWLHPLLTRGYQIHCGFDIDEPGEAASRQLITRYPSIQRLRPPRHDWNDALTAHNQ
jgi:hypothetical protein